MKKAKSVKQSKRFRNGLLIALGLSIVGTLFWFGRGGRQQGVQSAATVASQRTAAPASSSNAVQRTGIPPYRESAEEAKPFPKLLPAVYFSEKPLVARAYTIAAEIPGVIAQQPCYCFCDKYGHHSLLDCYASDHGAG